VPTPIARTARPKKKLRSNLIAGRGVAFNGDDRVANGLITVTNRSPDQILTLTQGANVTITGTYPNFTIAATDTDTTYSAGDLLDLVGTTFNVDLSELTDMTATMVGTDEFVVLDAGAQRRKAANEIGLSIFNNDAGFTTNVGDITGVTAGNGLTGGGASGSVTLNVGAGTGVTVAADTVSIGQAVATSDSPTFAGLTVQKTGDTTLIVKANSSGAGNDDATLILDAAETGEAGIVFRQDGVAKAGIEWFDAGNPDLNIRTDSGTNGVIDFQPNNSLAMRVSDGEVIVYDELDPRGGIKSHYDSGWTSVSNNNRYDFTHNLGLTGDQMLVMVFVRDASNRIFQIPSGYSNNTTNEVGPSIYHKSTNVVQIATGNDGIYAYDNTELSNTVTLLVSGEYRVKIMKWM